MVFTKSYLLGSIRFQKQVKAEPYKDREGFVMAPVSNLETLLDDYDGGGGGSRNGNKRLDRDRVFLDTNLGDYGGR